jgi:hypothetical protein
MKFHELKTYNSYITLQDFDIDILPKLLDSMFNSAKELIEDHKLFGCKITISKREPSYPFDCENAILEVLRQDDDPNFTYLLTQKLNYGDQLHVTVTGYASNE